MIPRFLRDCRKLLKLTLILMGMFATSNLKRCEPETTVIFRNVGVKLCQLKCIEHGQCLSFDYDIETLTCRLSRDDSKKIKKKEGYTRLSKNSSDIANGPCGPKTCTVEQRCLKTRSGHTVCVQDGKQTCTERPPQHDVDKQESFANSSFHDACKKGNLIRVRHILSLGLVDINSRDKRYGKTPLMMAAKEGQSRIVEFLLGKGANVSLVDNHGNNVLHSACRGGHVDMVRYLLSQHSVDINSRSKSGKNPLMTTVYYGHREVFDVLVDMGANVSQVDDDGDNVLHWACLGGHVDMVRYLLSQHSVDINSRSKSGKNPLMTTVYYGHREVFDVLVDMGANVSQVDDDGDNVLHWACLGGHVDMVRYLLSQHSVDINSRSKSGKNPLMTTVYYGHREVFDVLVGMGANVSQVDDDGDNVLHWACLGGHVDMVRYLLSQHSVDINSRSKSGKNPLMTTVYYGHREVFDVLVDMGANVSQVDDDGDNVLHWACLGGHVDMVRYLLSQHSVDINSRSKSGKNPLMTTVYYGHREVFDVLVDMGANVLQVDDDGDNVLHWACRGGYVDMVRYLLSQHSVDINSRSKSGKNPLMTTVSHGHREVFDVLVDMGANVSQVDDNGDNVLHWACLGGHVDMVRYLLSQHSVDINSRGQFGRTPLMKSISRGHREEVDVLVEMGANVSLVDDYGANILHSACRGGHVDMVKHLLSNYSVDINSRGMFGRTPLLTTVYFGYIDLFKYLVSLGANVSDVDDYGDNILHCASIGGRAMMIQHIISQDMVDINSRGRYGRTPLLRATSYGKTKAFDVLVSSGCLTDLVDDQGHTILHLACLGGRVEMVKYILSRNITDINARDKDGDTAAIIAKREGHHACYCLVSRTC